MLGCVALQGAGIGVQHSAQVVAGAIEVWAQAHGAMELGDRVLHQVVALCGGTHAGQLLQDEAPVVESLQHSAASAGALAAATRWAAVAGQQLAGSSVKGLVAGIRTPLRAQEACRPLTALPQEAEARATIQVRSFWRRACGLACGRCNCWQARLVCSMCCFWQQALSRTTLIRSALPGECCSPSTAEHAHNMLEPPAGSSASGLLQTRQHPHISLKLSLRHLAGC